jgi:hypothetical protein
MLNDDVMMMLYNVESGIRKWCLWWWVMTKQPLFMIIDDVLCVVFIESSPMNHIIIRTMLNDELCMHTTLTYKFWLETGTDMHIGLRNELHSPTCMLMYCECYVHFFNDLRLLNYDKYDVWMKIYNLINNCEYVVNDDPWCYVYLYIIHGSQLNVMMYILTSLLLLYLWCWYSWGANTRDEELLLQDS